MHELAIATALVEQVRRRAPAGARVVAVGVAIGASTGIVPDSLSFYVEGLTRGTPLEAARFDLVLVPARVRCAGCGCEYEPDGFIRVCTSCGTLGGVVLSGDELDLTRIEAELPGERAEEVPERV